MKTKSFIVKISAVPFLVVIAVAIVLSTPHVSRAKDIKTKMFYRDLQKSAKYVNDQYQLLMTIFNALTPEEVELINDSMKGSRSVKIFNSKVDAAMKKLSKFEFGPYGPKGVKFGDNHSGGIPRNLLTSYVIHVGDYYEVILKTYRIPVQDHPVALERYANYLIDLLDKLQELRAKQEEIGLSVHGLPKINGSILTIFKLCPTFIGRYPMGDQGRAFKDQVYDTWKRSTNKWMELYSDPNVLTVQKLWFEFILTNDLAHDKRGYSFDEAYMKELELIDQRLAAVSSAPNVSAGTKDESKSSDTDNSSAPATKKGNFKLDLPE